MFQPPLSTQRAFNTTFRQRNIPRLYKTCSDLLPTDYKLSSLTNRVLSVMIVWTDANHDTFAFTVPAADYTSRLGTMLTVRVLALLACLEFQLTAVIFSSFFILSCQDVRDEDTEEKTGETDHWIETRRDKFLCSDQKWNLMNSSQKKPQQNSATLSRLMQIGARFSKVSGRGDEVWCFSCSFTHGKAQLSVLEHPYPFWSFEQLIKAQ